MDFNTLYLSEMRKNLEQDRKITELKQEHLRAEEKLKKEIEMKEKRIKEMEVLIGEEKKLIQKEITKNNNLEFSIRMEAQKLENAESRICEKDYDNQNLMRQIQSLNTLIKDGDDKIASLNSDLRDENQKLYEKNEQLAIQDRELAVANARISQLESDLEELKKQLKKQEDSAEKKFRNSTKEIMDLYNKTLIDKSSLEKLNTELRQVQNDLRNSTDQSERIKPIIAQLNANYDEAQKNLQLVHDELLEYGRIIKSLNSDQQAYITNLHKILNNSYYDYNCNYHYCYDYNTQVAYDKLMARLLSMKKDITSIVNKDIVYF